MSIISIAQIIISILLIAAILIQERSSGLSGIFGGGGSEFYHTRRGLERVMFWGTIALVIAFAVLSIYSSLILKG
ncbi:MAG: preprotein translocase subunit SecG [Patescibacteria group bacterium]|nr:preprotein translocase subunit SecG [Patescibacteria group bacterium]